MKTNQDRAPREAVRAGGPDADPARLRDLAFLLHVSEDLARSLDPDEVLGTISRRLLQVVPAWRIGILLLEPDGGLRLAAGSERGGVPTDFPRGRLLDPSRYPEVAKAIATRRPVVVSNVATNVLMAGVRRPLEVLGLRALLVIPLVAHDRCLGVLSLGQRARARPFTARERSLLHAVANQAAVALRNAQLFAEVQGAARQLEGKVEERTRRLAASHVRVSILNEITTAINMGFDLDRILSAALSGLERLDNVDEAQVYLLDAGAREAEAHELSSRGELRRMRVPLGEPTGAALLNAVAGRPVSVEGGRSAGGDPAGRPGAPAQRSHLLAPLVSKEGVIGAVQIFSGAREAHLDADLDLLQQVAGELSIALERLALYRAAQRRSRQFEVISDIGRRVTQAVTLENLLPIAADLIRKSFDYSLTSILLLDEDGADLFVAGASSENPRVAERVLGHRQPKGRGLCGEALARGAAVNVPDVRAEPRFHSAEGVPTRSELVVPIKAGDEVLGVIDVQDDEPDAFTETDVALMETLADQLAAAMQLAELFADLRRGRMFTDQVINNLTAGLVVTDRKRVVQVVNQRAAEFLRIRSDELVGRDLLDVFPTAGPLFQYSYEAVGRECDVVLRDGVRLPLGFSNSFFVDASARRDAVIITFRDLSEVRELQRKVRHAERLATIGTVAAGVAHEIRNPLFGITATAQILARELPVDSPLHPLCKAMLDETRRLNDLVTSLVAYGKPQELKLRAVEPCRVLDDAIAASAARALELRCTVVHDCPPDGRTIEADADQLKQVILNLLLNAFDASPGGTVTVATAWDAPNGEIGLSVRDDGPGIRADRIEKVFELFFTTKARGSGLGLALSSRIVQDHGGAITASNHSDGGALFVVRLPLRRVERRRAPGAELHE